MPKWKLTELEENGWLGMNSQEIRQLFTDFFVDKHGHVAVPSSSLIPYDDPTVLLTTAGMQQFTPYFLGLQEPPARRLTSIQKCFRAVGKDDDVLEVGDPTHNTFFEMLGNFSVGDYFKDGAIDMAWELVTEGYGIAPERIWVTVEPSDDYSRDYWRDEIGLDASRIQDDPGNVWGPVGDFGPFGPNTELYVDLEWDQHGGDPGKGPMSEDEDRYLEIWNLVFMEFNHLPTGETQQLAMQNVDTGSGLERVAYALQGVNSIYETDLFQPIIERAMDIATVRYGDSENIDNALRIIADHTRGVTFLIADGVLPGNEGRGYVLRRILRRAVQKARTIGVERPFMGKLADVIVEHYGVQYPELRRRRDTILRALAHEEEAFGRTIVTGMSRLDALLERTGDRTTISGEDAFRLHDTYGFPIDLTIELADQAGYQVDVDGFRAALAEQRERSRANLDAFADASRLRAPLYGEIGRGTSRFVGYEQEQCETRIAAILGAEGRIESVDAGGSAEIVLEETPFYAEAGGQVGDTGEISTSTGVFRVTDTKRPSPDVVVHIGEVVEGFVEAGQAASAQVAHDRRADIRRNHTATHLIHAALREVLGPDTQQAGSLVAPDRLRFDFTSHRALGQEGLASVTAIANREVLADKPVVSTQEPFDDAVERGAMALFGEKYGDVVRTIEVPGYSFELCGGTHVTRTGEIGPIVILSESSIGSGVRRIEALTGEPALDYLMETHRLAQNLARDLRAPVENIERAVLDLQETIREKEREIERLRLHDALSDIDLVLQQARQVGETSVVAFRTDAGDRDTMLQLGDRVRDRLRSGVIVLGGQISDQAALIAMVTPDQVERGVHAGKIIQSIAPIIGGRGGGRPEMAQGGGSDVDRIDEALAAVDGVIEQQAG
ncbi:alanine--tRNA ligase [soil metagenome]